MALRGRAEDERLPEGVRISLNANFLTVADDIIGAKNVRFLNANDLEDSAVHWTDALV